MVQLVHVRRRRRWYTRPEGLLPAETRVQHVQLVPGSTLAAAAARCAGILQMDIRVVEVKETPHAPRASSKNGPRANKAEQGEVELVTLQPGLEFD